MDRGESFDSFDFDIDLIFHNQIESIAAVELHVFADHRQRFLVLRLVSSSSFAAHTLDTLRRQTQQAGTQMSVYSIAAPMIRRAIKWGLSFSSLLGGT